MSFIRMTAVALFLGVVAAPVAAQEEWHSPFAGGGGEPYICGRAWNGELGDNFSRLPARYEGKVTNNVWALSRESAGLALKFTTNSKNIKVRYVLGEQGRLLNMAWLNQSGVDLYGADAKGRLHWIGNHMNWKFYGDTTQISYYELSYPRGKENGTQFTLYLPPYNVVKSMEVGVDAGAKFAFERESKEKPVVVYGSSIVHGASPSRPGLMFTNIVSRELRVPVVNLGFSGSALMEPAVFDFLAEIDAAAYILDPMPNSFGLGDEIVSRGMAGVKRLRSVSAAPILMVESSVPGDTLFRHKYCQQYIDGNKRWRETYDKLRAEGVKGLYYLRAVDLHFTEESMIEGAHPNDLGNVEYARAYIKALKKALKSTRK